MPTGNTDKVSVAMPTGFDYATEYDIEKPIYQFMTHFGAELKLVNNGGAYELNLPPGEDHSDYELFVIYHGGADGPTQAGKLMVRTETPKTYPVTLVPMATGISTSEMAAQLNAIFAPYAITWNVKVADPFLDTSWDLDGDGKVDSGDEFLSVYSEEQLALHNAFKAQNGTEAECSVVFLFVLSNFRLQLPSDPTSRWTPLLSASGFRLFGSVRTCTF